VNRLPVGLAALSLLLAAAPARADRSSQPHPRPATGGLVAHAGLGTPHGFAGVSAEATLFRRVRLEAGIGRGFEGRQLAVMASALVGPRRAIGAGIGLSRGAYQWEELAGIECDDTCDARHWDAATWLNLQLAYRHRFAGRWQVGPYLGASLMLNPDDFTCPDEDLCGTDGDGERIYYAGVALGVTFGD
jgi:hypothetical protein